MSNEKDKTNDDLHFLYRTHGQILGTRAVCIALLIVKNQQRT